MALTYEQMFGEDRWKPTEREKQAGAPFAVPPEQWFAFPGAEYTVVVGIGWASAKSPVPVEVSIRRMTPLEPKTGDEEARLSYQVRERKAGGILFDRDPLPVSVRDMKRLPLASYVRAAVALVSAQVAAAEQIERTGEPAVVDRAAFDEALLRVGAPRGHPQRGRSAAFYKEIADAHRAFSARGKRPAVEIAKRKGVDRNLVDQWIFRARKMGFLEKVKED
jgi:hypothetical protein